MSSTNTYANSAPSGMGLADNVHLGGVLRHHKNDGETSAPGAATGAADYSAGTQGEYNTSTGTGPAAYNPAARTETADSYNPATHTVLDANEGDFTTAGGMTGTGLSGTGVGYPTDPAAGAESSLPERDIASGTASGYSRDTTATDDVPSTSAPASTSDPSAEDAITSTPGMSTAATGTRRVFHPDAIDSAPAHDAEVGARGSGIGTSEPQADYVPNPDDPKVYTAPHGYSTTSSMEPTRMNKLPLTENIQSVPEGGVALHGKTGLPEGKPSAIDRMVGKAQQEIGKQTENWSMYEKGVLREAGGAKAAKGEARAMI